MTKRKVKGPVPDRSHDLQVCGKHGVMLMGEPRPEHCPCCILGVEARPGDVPGDSVTIDDNEFRNRIEWPTMLRLVPLMRAYLADKKMGPMWVACASWTRDAPLPMGYNETERFFNVVAYAYGALHKAVACEGDAVKTVETLSKLYPATIGRP